MQCTRAQPSIPFDTIGCSIRQRPLDSQARAMPYTEKSFHSLPKQTAAAREAKRDREIHCATRWIYYLPNRRILHFLRSSHAKRKLIAVENLHFSFGDDSNDISTRSIAIISLYNLHGPHRWHATRLCACAPSAVTIRSTPWTRVHDEIEPERQHVMWAEKNLFIKNGAK